MRKFLLSSVVLGASLTLANSVNAQLLPPVTIDPPPVTVPPVVTPPVNVDIPPVTTPVVDVPPVTTPPVTIPPITTPTVNTPVVNIPPVTVGGDNIIDIPNTGVLTPGTPIDLGNSTGGIVGGTVTLPGGEVIQPILDSTGKAIGAVNNATGQILPVRPDGVVTNPQGQPIGNITNAGGAGGNGSGSGTSTANGGRAGNVTSNTRVDARNYNFSIPQAPLGYEEVTTTTEDGITTTRKGSVTTFSITGGSIAGEFVFLGQVAIPLR